MGLILGYRIAWGLDLVHLVHCDNSLIPFERLFEIATNQGSFIWDFMQKSGIIAGVVLVKVFI